MVLNYLYLFIYVQISSNLKSIYFVQMVRFEFILLKVTAVDTLHSVTSTDDDKVRGHWVLVYGIFAITIDIHIQAP